jgi:hypothetical protein
MTTAASNATSHPSRVHLLALAVAASVIHLLMMIPGYSDHEEFQTLTWLGVLAFSLVVSVLLFVLVVPGRGAITGIVLGVVALVSVVVFWAGVTLPLAAAAGAVGWRAWTERHDKAAGAALLLSALTTVALVAIIISDAIDS